MHVHPRLINPSDSGCSLEWIPAISFCFLMPGSLGHRQNSHRAVATPNPIERPCRAVGGRHPAAAFHGDPEPRRAETEPALGLDARRGRAPSPLAGSMRIPHFELEPPFDSSILLTKNRPRRVRNRGFLIAWIKRIMVVVYCTRVPFPCCGGNVMTPPSHLPRGLKSAAGLSEASQAQDTGLCSATQHGHRSATSTFSIAICSFNLSTGETSFKERWLV